MISIIVPVYNAEKYLNECVRALCNQSYVDTEIILVDDGSTDSSGAICDELASQDCRIRVIHKENGGASSARNTGIDNALGEYIMFCDSDDFVDKNWCSTLITFAESHPERLTICGIKYINSNEPLEEQIESTQQKNNEATDYKCYELKDIFYVTKLGILFSTVNKIYKTEILKKHKIYFNTAKSLGEDALFNMQYIKHCSCKTLHIHKELYYYREDMEQSLSKANDLVYTISDIEIYKAYKLLFKQINDTPPPPENIFTEMHSFFFNRFFERALYSSHDKTLSKGLRLKIVSKNILSPAFRECRQDAIEDCGHNSKLFKLSKYPFLLYLYIVTKHIIF